MSNVASYILSSYSFIDSYPLNSLLEVGNRSKDGNPIPSFDENTLIGLCFEAKKIFEKEQNNLELDGHFIIVGDIHGNLHDLLRILNYIKENAKKVLFLGDYIDRGNFSLECITILFALKILHPGDVFLLRGNHEFDSMCSKYGFKEEIMHNSLLKPFNSNIEKLIDQSEIDKDHSYILEHNQSGCYNYTENLYDAFIQAFSFMPISALINKTTFCIHGGLCPELNSIKIIQTKIQRPILKFEENKLLKNVLWGDPSLDTVNMYTENQRGCGYQFNFEAVHFFLVRNSIKRIIRGYQYATRGYSRHFQNKCITVFSASSYNGDMSNYSGILKLNQENDSVECISFFPIKIIYRNDAFFYKVKVFNNISDSYKPRCYLFPPLSAFATNSTIKLLPNKAFRKASSNPVHLSKYPIHPNPRKTNPLIKINTFLLGKSSLSLLEGVEKESKNFSKEDGIINHFPVIDL